MKVLGVNSIELLSSILGWAHTATLGNAAKVLGVSVIWLVISIFGWLFYRSFYQRQDQLSPVALAVWNEERDDEPSSCLQGDSMHRSSEGVKNDPILEPKHKIFLSHSGAQKEFVEHLCQALEDRLHYPFFDRRHESLPKGERFAELIVRAAEQCEMLIVVVSNEYFMSKWPMIELNAFVRAHKLCHESRSSTTGPKILPLFYGLSVRDLEDASKRKKWFRRWESLAKSDPKHRIIVRDWKYALDVLGSFNGLPYDMNLKEIVAYEEKIVSCVCKSIVPDRKWDDSHVQGKSSILKVIDEKIKGIGLSKKYQVKVVGIFGVGGVGKTTTCKTMCNEVSSQYEGRVCHLEFSSVPSGDSKEFFQQALRDLTRKSAEVIQQMNEGECKNILRNTLFQYKSFLAIDNISDHHQSIQQAKAFLEVPYEKDSLVVVTARSQSVLKLLGIDGDACFEMPNLEESDAMNLFLHHAAVNKQIFKDKEKRHIMTCVRRCHFSKGTGEDDHYHPLALQALGLQLGCHGENPCEWVKHLPRVRTFNYFSGGNPVFDILRSSFDMLSPRDQTLFMDVGCFYERYFYSRDLFLERLCTLHKQDEEELVCRLKHLKRKGLLQDVSLRFGGVSIHDLYLEFAKLEAKGSFNESTTLRDRMWVLMKDGDLTELECRPEGGCWHKLIRLSIVQSPPLALYQKHGRIVGQVGSLGGMKWNYFSNVEVLQLFGLHWGHGALNLDGLVRLRILELSNVRKLDRVEGLDKLNHLTCFEWITSEPSFSNGIDSHIVGQLPSSLRSFYISMVDVVLEPDLLARCHNLSNLNLISVEAHLLDLSNCRSLESVSLWGIRSLQTLLGLAACPASSLRSLYIYRCENLVDIPGIDHLIGLKELNIHCSPKCEVPNLLALIELQVLNISGEQRLLVPAKDYFPRQLRELRWCLSRSSEGLNLSGFDQLEDLDLSSSYELTSLAELGDLPALRHLSLGFCEHLLRLPDLSMSRDLQKLELNGCSALELHEKDIQMLSALPFLQLVLFSGMLEEEQFRLDFARGKVLVHSKTGYYDERWKEDEWEELDLGAPPIKIGRRGSWEVDRIGRRGTRELDQVDSSDWYSD